MASTNGDVKSGARVWGGTSGDVNEVEAAALTADSARDATPRATENVVRTEGYTDGSHSS